MGKWKENVLNHLIKYKNETLKIKECGVFWRDKKEKIHILPYDKISQNLIDKVLLYEVNHLHPGFAHLNSSQALCINFFTKIRDKDILIKLINKMIGNKLQGTSIVKSTFELKEVGRSQIDFYFKTNLGEQCYFEVKYTEEDFGQTSQSVIKEDADKYSRVWQRVWKNHLANSEYLSRMSEEEFYFQYQINRNISCIKKDEKSFVIFLYPFKNEELHRIINPYLSYKKYDNVFLVDWYNIYNELEKIVKKDKTMLSYYKEFYAKYLDV